MVVRVDCPKLSSVLFGVACKVKLGWTLNIQLFHVVCQARSLRSNAQAKPVDDAKKDCKEKEAPVQAVQVG